MTAAVEAMTWPGVITLVLTSSVISALVSTGLQHVLTVRRERAAWPRAASLTAATNFFAATHELWVRALNHSRAGESYQNASGSRGRSAFADRVADEAGEAWKDSGERYAGAVAAANSALAAFRLCFPRQAKAAQVYYQRCADGGQDWPEPRDDRLRLQEQLEDAVTSALGLPS